MKLMNNRQEILPVFNIKKQYTRYCSLLVAFYDTHRNYVGTILETGNHTARSHTAFAARQILKYEYKVKRLLTSTKQPKLIRN